MQNINRFKGTFIGVFFVLFLTIGNCFSLSYQDWEIGQTLKINFQPPYLIAPNGYLLDGGEGYGDRYNGFNYGWVDAQGVSSTNLGYRIIYAFDNYTKYDSYYGFYRLGGDLNGYYRRNYYNDERIEPTHENYTFNFLNKYGVKYNRQINIPNGTYNIRLLNYDPQFLSPNEIKINGQIYQLSGHTTINNVKVTDKMLILENTNDDQTNETTGFTKINYLEITPSHFEYDENRTETLTDLQLGYGVNNQNTIPTSIDGWQGGNYEGKGFAKIKDQDYETCKNCRLSGVSNSPTICDIWNNTNYSSNFDNAEFCRKCDGFDLNRWIDTTGNNRRFGCGKGSIAPWESPETIGEFSYKSTKYEIDSIGGKTYVKDNFILSNYSQGINPLYSDFTFDGTNSYQVQLVLDTQNVSNSIPINGNLKCIDGNINYTKAGSSNSFSFSPNGKALSLSFKTRAENNVVFWKLVCESPSKPTLGLTINENEINIQPNSLKPYSLSSFTPSSISSALRNPRPADQTTFTNILFHQLHSIESLIFIMKSLNIIDESGSNLSSRFVSSTDYNNYKTWLSHFSNYGSIKHFSDSFSQSITLNDIYYANVIINGYVCSIKNKLNSLGKISSSCTNSLISLDKFDKKFVFFNFQQIIDQQKVYINHFKDIANFYKTISTGDSYISNIISFILTDTSNNILGYGLNKNISNISTLSSVLSATSGGKPNLNSLYNSSLLLNYSLRGTTKLAIIYKNLNNLSDPNVKSSTVTDIYTLDLSYIKGYISSLSISNLAEAINILKLNSLLADFSTFVDQFGVYYSNKITSLEITNFSTYDFIQEILTFLDSHNYTIKESTNYKNIVQTFNIYY